MKTLLTTLIFLVSHSLLISQNLEIPEGVDSVRFILNELSKSTTTFSNINRELVGLKKSNQKLKYNIWYRDSIDYEDAFNKVLMAISVSEAISIRMKLLNVGIDNDLAFISIAQSQNIMSGDFPDVMAKEAARMLKNEQNPDKKAKWLEIVKRIAGNPMLQTVLKSNPVSSAVLSIANAASGWVSLSINSNDKKQIDQTLAVDSTEVNKFVSRMRLYIAFYEDLNKLNIEFASSLNRINVTYNSLNDSITLYDAQLSQALQADKSDGNKGKAALKIFKVRDQVEFNSESDINRFKNILTDPNVVNVVRIASKWQFYKTRLDSYESEYRSELILFFSEYENMINVRSRTSSNTILEILNPAALNSINTSFKIAINANNMRLEDIKKK